MTATQGTTRYGFYYYPDTLHYRDTDIRSWIPELHALGASWLTLLAPMDRAIPESFIHQVVEAGIQPVIHMPLPTHGSGISNELGIIFKAYARWGVRYISLFDRPNLMRHWTPANWAHKNLVERFLDIYIPYASGALNAYLTPVFPALEPGGDYWDIAFLYSALQGLQRRGQQDMLDQLVLAAYAWPGNRSPNWGAGGPERWPQARPYSTPPDSEDHLGFRIFDWYLSIAETVLGKTLPIILLGAGSKIGDQPDQRSPAVDVHAHTWQNLTLARLMTGRSQEYDPVPPEVLTCNFWLLSAAQDHQEVKHAWYKPGEQPLPVVTMIKEMASGGSDKSASSSKSIRSSAKYFNAYHPISHYLLLPSKEWGQSGWKLDAIRPFIDKFQPTIGFSAVEASHAKKVTVISGNVGIPEAIIDGLLAAGCIVEQINGDGMNVASSQASHI
jgi:hypothetical protein